MRERILKVFLVVVGLVFCALAYPLVMFIHDDPAAAMMFSLYVTLGVFLILAARNPLANRTLIAFTAWSSLAHASVMAVQVARHYIRSMELMGVIVFGLIGIALLVLRPTAHADPLHSSARASIAS